MLSALASGRCFPVKDTHWRLYLAYLIQLDDDSELQEILVYFSMFLQFFILVISICSKLDHAFVSVVHEDAGCTSASPA
jgi:hypothetical protein